MYSFIITVGAKRFDCSDVFLRLVRMACGNGLKYGELYGWNPSGRTTPHPSSFASSARRWSGVSTDQICTGPVYTSIDNVPPLPTLHLCDAARSKHRYIHIRPEVVGWAPLGDLAPQSTSFGTVALRERQHLAMAATCPEGEAWAASRNWNHGTHFLWDPRAAPTFHPLSTQRHRVQHSAFHFPSPQR